MKTLLLLLLSLNAYSEIKVPVIDYKGRTSCGDGCIFDSVQKAQEWINDNKENNSWGKPDRWLIRESEETCSGVERQSGNMVDGFFYECFYEVEYTICGQSPNVVDIATHCEDITSEIIAAKVKKDADDIIHTNIKSAVRTRTLTPSEISEWIRIKEGL